MLSWKDPKNPSSTIQTLPMSATNIESLAPRHRLALFGAAHIPRAIVAQSQCHTHVVMRDAPCLPI